MTIQEQLAKEEITPMHAQLLKLVKDSMKSSREKMSQFYEGWDRSWDTYRTRRNPTAEDKEAAKQGLPTKQTIPLTYAQVNSFVAFAFMLLRQKEDFFEFSGVSDKDKKVSKHATTLASRDFNLSSGVQNLWQTLHNLAIFGIAVQRDSFVRENVHVPTQHPTVDGGTVTTWKEVPKFVGNRIEVISPFRFFPDTNYPLARWNKGCFVASETEMNRTDLQKMPDVFGLEFVEGIRLDSSDSWGRRAMRSQTLDWTQPNKNKDVLSITDYFRVNLIPSDVKCEETGEVLGNENFPVPYIIWVANDQRVIKCTPANYLHSQLPYSVGLFSPDDNTMFTGSLAEDIDALQGTISWFLNSRIASVSRMIDNRWIVDPTGIELSSIQNNSRTILLKRAAARTDVRRYITQVQQQDVTTGHVGDANNLIGLMQMVTGINDNAMGSYNGGRRSATEARSVVQGAAARMKVTIDLLWNMMFVPQGNRLASNHRQSLSDVEFAKLVGEENKADYEFFHGNPEDLVSGYDFILYDGSLPSEKGFLAQSLQELLGLLLSSPGAALQFNIDPKSVMKEIYTLRGVGSLNQFEFDPMQLEQMKQQQMQQQMMEQGLPQGGPPPTQ